MILTRNQENQNGHSLYQRTLGNANLVSDTTKMELKNATSAELGLTMKELCLKAQTEFTSKEPKSGKKLKSQIEK